jgi:hypothetical protein
MYSIIELFAYYVQYYIAVCILCTVLYSCLHTIYTAELFSALFAFPHLTFLQVSMQFTSCWLFTPGSHKKPSRSIHCRTPNSHQRCYIDERRADSAQAGSDRQTSSWCVVVEVRFVAVCGFLAEGLTLRDGHGSWQVAVEARLVPVTRYKYSLSVSWRLCCAHLQGKRFAQ